MTVRAPVTLLLCLATLFAQQKAPTNKIPPAAPNVPAQFPLETLRVEGNHHISAAKIIAFSGLKIGRTVVKEDFEAARTRLIQSGAFSNAGYEYKPSAAGTGYDGMLEVTELNEFYPFRFEDLPAKDGVLRA